MNTLIKLGLLVLTLTTLTRSADHPPLKMPSKARLFCPAQFQKFHPHGRCYVASDGKAWDCSEPPSMECLAMMVEKDGDVRYADPEEEPTK